MPFAINKVSPRAWEVVNTKTGRTHAKHTTKKNAEAQVRLLHGIDSGKWKPTEKAGGSVLSDSIMLQPLAQPALGTYSKIGGNLPSIRTKKLVKFAGIKHPDKVQDIARRLDLLRQKTKTCIPPST